MYISYIYAYNRHEAYDIIVLMPTGNGGGDQVQVGPSPFTSVMGQAPLSFTAATNGVQG